MVQIWGKNDDPLLPVVVSVSCRVDVEQLNDDRIREADDEMLSTGRERGG